MKRVRYDRDTTGGGIEAPSYRISYRDTIARYVSHENGRKPLGWLHFPRYDFRYGAEPEGGGHSCPLPDRIVSLRFLG